eukprot:1711497-Rhodomonas_salina.3
MQRQGLVSISEFVALNKGIKDEEELSLLEVACGTGRQHTFIKDNWPKMRTTASDLSPFYLQVRSQTRAEVAPCQTPDTKRGAKTEKTPASGWIPGREYSWIAAPGSMIGFQTTQEEALDAFATGVAQVRRQET